MTPEEIWDKYQADADWEKYDFVDPPYCWACIITLDVDGYHFEGEGQIILDTDREIEELWCDTPEGEHIKII